jgi:murein DD-endopeptidase MepM/ murein hydrolase activator NlpD
VKPDALGALGAPAAAAPEPREPRQIRGSQTSHDARDGAQVAAKQLEAFFLRQLLAEARPQGGGTLDGGFAGDTFKQMLDEAIADKMTAAGGIGLTSMFAKQLGSAGGSPEVAHAPTPPIANLPPNLAHPIPTHAGASSLDPSPSDTPSHPDGMPRFLLPVAGRPTSGYGLRTDPVHGKSIHHAGFDLASTAGTEVAAAARGTVVHAGPAGTYGNLVTLRHDNGFETRYAHLSAVDVQVGDQIEAGQGVGKVGSTGHSTGPHLHFEIRQDGRPIDPAPHLPLNRSPVRTTR